METKTQRFCESLIQRAKHVVFFVMVLIIIEGSIRHYRKKTHYTDYKLQMFPICRLWIFSVGNIKLKGSLTTCHYCCSSVCLYLLAGDPGPPGGTGLHRQHPRRGAVQSPPAIFWQLAASSTVVATGGEGAEQTSVARRGPWGGRHQTHQSAHHLPASHRHHGGRPRQVRPQTTDGQVCALIDFTAAWRSFGGNIVFTPG